MKNPKREVVCLSIAQGKFLHVVYNKDNGSMPGKCWASLLGGHFKVLAFAKLVFIQL